MQPRPEKGCDEKDVKSKGGGQGLCRNAVNHIKNFDNDDPGHKIFWHLGVIIIKLLMWSTAFLHRPGHPLLISHFFQHSLFQVLAATFFTARVFLVESTLLCPNFKHYMYESRDTTLQKSYFPIHFLCEVSMVAPSHRKCIGKA